MEFIVFNLYCFLLWFILLLVVWVPRSLGINQRFIIARSPSTSPSVFLFSPPLPPTILTCPNSPFFGPNFSPSHCFQCSAPGEDLSSRHQALHQGLQGHTNYHILVQSALGSAGVVGLYYCSFQASAAAAAARAATTSNHQDEDRGTQLATTTRPRFGLGDVCAPWRPFCLCQ